MPRLGPAERTALLRAKARGGVELGTPDLAWLREREQERWPASLAALRASGAPLAAAGDPPHALRNLGLGNQAVFGQFTSTGGVNGTSSGNFTVAHTGTGVFTITFGTAFADTGYGIGLAVATAGFSASGVNKAVGSFQINTFNASNVAADAGCSFIIFGF